MPRWTRFRRLFGPEPKADVDAELAFHVEMRIRELIEQGEPPERARTLALQRFGDYDSSRAACVEISQRRGRRMARTGVSDRAAAGRRLRVAHAAPRARLHHRRTHDAGARHRRQQRHLQRRPGRAACAPALPRRRTAVSRHDALPRRHTIFALGARLHERSRADPHVRSGRSVLGRRLHHARRRRAARGSRHERERRPADLLGLPVTLGRPFLPGENQPGHDRVAVLDHGFWQRQFGGDRSVLGRTVSIAGTQVEIVGVLAPDAHLPRRCGCLPATGVRRDIQRGDGEGAARRVPHGDCPGEARRGPRADRRRSAAHRHAAADGVSRDERHADVQRGRPSTT